MSDRRILIRGGTLLTMDPALGDLHADVLVVGDRIASVAPEIHDDDAPILDASGFLVLPGFVDTHRHTWQTVVRHVGVGWDVPCYMRRCHATIAPAMTPQDVYLGTYVGAMAALDAGTTTVCDESHVQHSPEHTERAIQALRDAGIRARFGYGWSAGPRNLDESELGHPADMRRVREQILADDAARVTMYAMLRGPVLATPEVNADDLRRARELGLRASLHVAQPNWSRIREIPLLRSQGLLGPDLTFIHCGDATDEELRTMAEAGVKLSVAPAIETVMPGVGLPATARAIEAGVQPSLSIDTEVAGSGDMFSAMRAAYAHHQIRGILDPAFADRYGALSPRRLLELGTIAGADACGLGDVVGSITPGKRADLVLLDAGAPNLCSIADPAAAILTSAHAGNVDTVVVDGELRKHRGKLVERSAFDRARDEMLAAGERLVAGTRG